MIHARKQGIVRQHLRRPRHPRPLHPPHLLRHLAPRPPRCPLLRRLHLLAARLLSAVAIPLHRHPRWRFRWAWCRARHPSLFPAPG